MVLSEGQAGVANHLQVKKNRRFFGSLPPALPFDAAEGDRRRLGGLPSRREIGGSRNRWLVGTSKNAWVDGMTVGWRIDVLGF